MDSDVPPAVAHYKRLLKAYLDKRPSGTRKRLAEGLGTHRSFVSQITNPSYRVAIPAHHVQTILRVCRLTADERRDFLDAYAAAHPSAGDLSEAPSALPTRVVIVVPEFRSARRQANVIEAIEEMASRIIALAQDAEQS